MNWLNSPYVIALFPLVMSMLLLLAKGQILRLPSWVQPFVPVVTTGVPVVLTQYESVGIAAALLAGLVAGLEAIGVYHAVGKVRKSMAPSSPDTLRAGSALLCLLALAAITGCAGSFEEAKLAGVSPQARAAAAPPSARCMSLDNQHRVWGAVGKGTAVLAGAEGLSTIVTDNEKLQTGLAIGALATGAISATAVYVSEDAATSWARECQ